MYILICHIIRIPEHTSANVKTWIYLTKKIPKCSANQKYELFLEWLESWEKSCGMHFSHGAQSVLCSCNQDLRTKREAVQWATEHWPGTGRAAGEDAGIWEWFVSTYIHNHNPLSRLTNLIFVETIYCNHHWNHPGILTLHLDTTPAIWLNYICFASTFWLPTLCLLKPPYSLPLGTHSGICS